MVQWFAALVLIDRPLLELSAKLEMSDALAKSVIELNVAIQIPMPSRGTGPQDSTLADFSGNATTLQIASPDELAKAWAQSVI